MTSTDLWRQAVPRRSRWVRPPALALAGFLAATAVTGWFFLCRPTGQIVDQLALLGAKSYAHHSSTGLTARVYDLILQAGSSVVGIVGPWYIAAVIALLLALTVWRRAWWLGAGAVITFAGANLTTQVIKALWDRPELGLYETYGNSWPSGHTTLAAGAAFAVLLLLPARWRGPAALSGGVFTAFMAWGTLMTGWHRPSDTVAAICVSAVWYVLVETVRRRVVQVPFEERVGSRVAIRIHDVLAGICAALGLGILAAVALTLPDGPVDGIETAVQRLAFVGAFFGIAAVSIGASRVLLAVGPCEDGP